jgi:hypothetical protein
MPAVAIAAELDSRNLRRENRSLVMSSFMAIPFSEHNLLLYAAVNCKVKNVEGIFAENGITAEGGETEIIFGVGGRDRGRTGDLIVANDALSQLSYSPTSSREILTRTWKFEIRGSKSKTCNDRRSMLGLRTLGRRWDRCAPLTRITC